MHDKELLAIFSAFSTWHHYLEGTLLPVNVVTDHKNLEYFSMTKMLNRRQACWSKFLSAFNMVIHFQPGHLGAKPNSLTRQWDIYPKEGDSTYSTVNPHNFWPIFTTEQLCTSLQLLTLANPVLHAGMIIDTELLHEKIISATSTDLNLQAQVGSNN